MTPLPVCQWLMLLLGAAGCCSVHLRENEGVVAAVLEQAQEAGFQLVDPFPAWHRRGVAGAVEGAEKLVRTGVSSCSCEPLSSAVL